MSLRAPSMPVPNSPLVPARLSVPTSSQFCEPRGVGGGPFVVLVSASEVQLHPGDRPVEPFDNDESTDAPQQHNDDEQARNEVDQPSPEGAAAFAHGLIWG